MSSPDYICHNGDYPMRMSKKDHLICDAASGPWSVEKTVTLPDTLEAVCAQMETDPKTSPELMTNIQGVRRAFKHDPSLAKLRPTGRVVVPRMHRLARMSNLTHKSLQNMLANIRAVLKEWHAQSPGQYHKTSLAGGWLKYYKLLGNDRNLTINLSRFFHWCQASRIEISNVSDGVFEQYRTYLDDVVGVKNACAKCRLTAKHWNAAVEEIAGWPKSTLTPPSVRKKPRSTVVAEMPPLLRIRPPEAALCG